MRYLPKRYVRRSSQQHLLRAVHLLLTRSILLLIVLSLSFLLFLTSLGSSPPPAALIHATGGRARRNSDLRQCGCTRADHCTTAVPVGSFQAPHISRDIETSLPPSVFENEKRRRLVRSVAMSAWDAYVVSAWGFDELRPISAVGADTFGGLAATIVEALPTLYVMRLSSRYEAARDWIHTNLDFDKVSEYVSVHEITTRILGALMSSYHLTGDDMFLQKAEALGERLAPAFNTLNGVPYPRCRLSQTNSSTPHTAESVCEGHTTTQSAAAGLSLEFRALAYHSLSPHIRELRCKADRAVQAVVEAGPDLLRDEITYELMRQDNRTDVAFQPSSNDEGEQMAQSRFSSIRLTSMHSYYAYVVELWQEAVSAVGAGPTVDTTATFSTPARGFYEYITKAWRQGGSCESALRYPLDASMQMLLRRAIYESPTGDLYLRTFEKRHNDSKAVVEQAMCYLPAVFHLAAKYKGISARQEDLWRDVAEGITQSCINMYKQFPTRLGGDSARYNGRVWVTKGAYKLQADLVEALFYMWRATKSQEYRDEAWKTYLSIHRECKLETGAFTVLDEAAVGNVTKGDRMSSDFLGSTLKFLYLTFCDEHVLPLDEWIFNRAGHPLLVSPGIGALNPCRTDLVR